MTPEELMQIESYLLDRKKPDYELSGKIMNALDLINRQQAEVESVNKRADMWHREAELNAAELIKMQAEIERLKEQFYYLDIECVRLEKANETAKSEAIKEFAERLKAKKHECGCNYRKKPVYAVTEKKIDETYKEMVGDAE